MHELRVYGEWKWSQMICGSWCWDHSRISDTRTKPRSFPEAVCGKANQAKFRENKAQDGESAIRRGHSDCGGSLCLCVDPAKVEAILQMPCPRDAAAVQRLLGLTQYLSKFLPHLLDMTKPHTEGHGLDLGPCTAAGAGLLEEGCYKHTGATVL